MAYCTQCGKPNLEGAKFCTTCGNPLTIQQKEPSINAVDNTNTSRQDQKPINLQNTDEDADIVNSTLLPQRAKKRLWIILAAILIIGGGIAAYFLVFANRTEPHKTLYVLPDNLKFRSSQYDNSDANIISSVNYGNPISIVKEEGDWMKVKFNDQEGYMRTKYLTNEKDFFETDAIIHSIGAADTIKETRFKKSLLDYFRLKNYKPPFLQATDYIKQTFLSDTSSYKNKEEWRIVQSTQAAKTYIRGRFNNASKQGMAVIIEKSIENQNTRKLLIFNYDDNENALPVAEFTGKFLWLTGINKTADIRWFVNNIYQLLTYNSVLANDGNLDFLFMYDGNIMQKYEQPQEYGD